jgi:hypothetical protein
MPVSRKMTTKDISWRLTVRFLPKYELMDWCGHAFSNLDMMGSLDSRSARNLPRIGGHISICSVTSNTRLSTRPVLSSHSTDDTVRRNPTNWGFLHPCKKKNIGAASGEIRQTEVSYTPVTWGYQGVDYIAPQRYTYLATNTRHK